MRKHRCADFDVPGGGKWYVSEGGSGAKNKTAKKIFSLEIGIEISFNFINVQNMIYVYIN